MIKETVTGFDELVLKVVRIQIKCNIPLRLHIWMGVRSWHLLDGSHDLPGPSHKTDLPPYWLSQCCGALAFYS